MDDPVLLLIDLDPPVEEKLKEYIHTYNKNYHVQVPDPEEDLDSLLPELSPTTVIVCQLQRNNERSNYLLTFFRRVSSILLLGAGEEQREFAERAVHAGVEEVLPLDGEDRFLALIPILIRKIITHKDITGTQKEIIWASEKRYEQLLQAVPDIVYKLDPSGHFTFVNNSIRALGYTPASLIGKHFSVLFEQKEVERISRKHVVQKLKGISTGAEKAPKLFDERRRGERKTSALEVKLKHGGKKDFYGSIIAYGEVSAVGQYMSKEGESFFTGTVGLIRDITERKKTEAMLQKLYQTIDQSSFSLIIADAEGTIEYVNPYFFRHISADPSTLLGKSLETLSQFGYPASFFTRFRDTLSTALSWHGEITVKPPEKETYWGWCTVNPIRDQEGEITHGVIMVENITPRKKAELSLQANEEKYRKIIETMKEGVVVADSGGIIVLWSRGLERILGIKSDEIIQTPIWELPHNLFDLEKKDEAGYRNQCAYMEKLYRDSSSTIVNIREQRIEKKDGEVVFIQNEIFPITTVEGLMLAAVLRDIHED